MFTDFTGYCINFIFIFHRTGIEFDIIDFDAVFRFHMDFTKGDFCFFKPGMIQGNLLSLGLGQIHRGVLPVFCNCFFCCRLLLVLYFRFSCRRLVAGDLLTLFFQNLSGFGLNEILIFDSVGGKLHFIDKLPVLIFKLDVLNRRFFRKNPCVYEGKVQGRFSANGILLCHVAYSIGTACPNRQHQQSNDCDQGSFGFFTWFHSLFLLFSLACLRCMTK